ncbi:MAG: MarR family transcriptional regulator [Spirochaetes bacterium]|nr:MarR family transcriptional regulator [Spirochaetota bacterium]
MEVNRNNFLYALTKIRQRIFAFLEEEMAEKDIDDIAPSHGHILFILDTKGPLSLMELARFAEKDKSTVSSVITRLEEKGYVAKVKGAEDGRFVKIRLTARAKKIRPVLWGISAAMNERLFRGFSQDEKSKLFELVGKMLNNL